MHLYKPRRNVLMKNLKQNLKATANELKALTKKTEILMKAVDKLEKSQPATKPKTKAVKARVPERAPAKKKATQLTATDQVLRIIKRSKKGVNAATLMTKTGFDLKKVRNILQRTYKQGKIKRADKGIYIAA